MHPSFTDAGLARLTATSRLIWGTVAAMAVILAAGYWTAGLSLDLWSGGLLLPIAPACLGIAWVYRVHRPDPWISFGADAAAQIVSIIILGALISYAAASTSFPYRDAELYALDRALGFHWHGYLAFFNAYPILGLIGHLAYFSMKPQIVLVIFALVISARIERLQQFTLALAISLAITIAIFIFVPAVAYYAHLGVTPAEFANLSPSVPYEHIRHLEGVRTGSTTVIRFDDLEGLITFPSFHTTAAILFTWALWVFPRARWWVLALNAAMIAATPIDGAHYVVDLAGGAVVAAVAIRAGVRLTEWSGNRVLRRQDSPLPAARGVTHS